jgi:hypothetical protein
MSKKVMTTLATLAVAFVFVLSVQSVASAQGRGRGGGGSAARGSSSGGGNPGMGRPAGVGVDRGISTSSGRSDGRSDTGRSTASARSNGRSDEGIARARLQRENARRAEEDLREHPQMAARLNMSANALRAGYQAALAANPDLKFGEYVAATRLSANLGSRYPNVTREAILAGLARGDSIGETLQALGLSEREAKLAKKRAEHEIKQARRRS